LLRKLLLALGTANRGHDRNGNDELLREMSSGFFLHDITGKHMDTLQSLDVEQSPSQYDMLAIDVEEASYIFRDKPYKTHSIVVKFLTESSIVVLQMTRISLS